MSKANNGTRELLIGIGVALIGAITLATPGGWDWISAINLFMGGLLIGIGLTVKSFFS